MGYTDSAARATAEYILSALEQKLTESPTGTIDWKDIMNFRILFLGRWRCWSCGSKDTVYADDQGRVYCHGPCLNGTHPDGTGPQGTSV